MNVKYFITLILVALTIVVYGQNRTVSGTVTDEIGEPLIGVNVVYGPGLGVVTDMDGAYSLTLPQGNYELSVSYVGFEPQSKQITVSGKNLFIDFRLKTITLSEVEVVGDVAKTRETPIAFSNISPVQIEEQLAAQDIPLILNATPGVYATASGGGDGDARINIRGFNQRNVAVMLDGIPVNDMENGWVYWSNWFGLDAVMRYTQVQRGLGASKLAIPSVGGTINIATKGIDNKKGISLKQEVGSDGYLRTTLGLTTGRLANGWGVTFAGSYKRGDGWVDQTWTKGWFYFLRVDKEIGKHMLSVTAMGAPQEHGQRSYKKYIATFDTDYALEAGMTQEFINNLKNNGLPVNRGLRYNPNWGYLSRAYITDTDTIFPGAEPTSTANNFYHKPMFSLRDFWSVSEKLYISNILYLSLGNGGGQSFSTTPGNDTVTWQQDLQKQYNSNLNLIPPYFNSTKVSSNIMRNAMNNHFWLGLLSTFDYSLSKSISISGGLDLRTYKGEHYREVADLFGGNYFLDDGNQNENNDTTKKFIGDKIGYYNDALVRWGGVFAQIEYMRGNLSAFLNVTGSMSGYKRVDYFLPHAPEEEANETPWKYIPGFTVKAGANYNLSESMNVFMNLGFISKAQRFNNVYDRSNTLFRDIKNEQVRAIELGYSYFQPRFTLNVNAYYTSWLNKPADRAMSVSIDGEFYSVNINDMNARHMGVEFEFAWKILDNLTFESLLSLGDWIWTSADTARIYDDNGQQIGVRPFDARGLYVGDAAQFQNRESLRWEIIRGLYASGSFTWFGKHYAEFNPLDYDPERYPGSFDENGDPKQSWKIPNYYVVDFHAGYSWWIKKVGFQVRGSIINLLDSKFITDAQNNDPYLTHSSGFDANSAGVFMGMGRRFNLSLRISL
ncbi:MAG: carboxypeptidase-like regulatory domain-containing protein [Bacteroidales bacterium]|jgi:outer membrane receptor for ferrienterochelin and colicin|nr:carboxypeptidase-like regulatory domain-containing protein [Bacteroidales bacterium]